jgi:Ca2+-binding EF-hand superfamily protein
MTRTTCNRTTLLAIALGAVLAAPSAFAQSDNANPRATGNAAAQAAQATPRPTLPEQAAQPARDAVQDVTQQRPTEQTMPPPEEPEESTAPPADATDFKEARDATEAPASMQSQGAANAAPHSAVVQRDAWTRLDVDADGRISPTEADADAAFGLDFDDMDTDDDGFVSDAEFRAFARVDGSMEGGQGAANATAHSMVVTRDLWTRLDTDADGRISTTEADADATFDGDFAGFDANADGFVSQDEYRAAAQAEVSQGAENAAPPSAVVQRDTWTRLDADADGRISADEADADAGFDAGFAMMDSNGDGFVTDAEFRAHARTNMQP